MEPELGVLGDRAGQVQRRFHMFAFGHQPVEHPERHRLVAAEVPTAEHELARPGQPTILGSRYDTPASHADRPTLMKTAPNRPSGVATRHSAANASASPPPTAGPCTAATTGLAHSLDSSIRDQVGALRHRGITWQRIADELGVTRQATQQRSSD